VGHGAAAWQHQPEEKRHRGGEREETTLVGPMQILLSRKMKKFHVIDSAATKWTVKI
jgi:hypothetical protein